MRIATAFTPYIHTPSRAVSTLESEVLVLRRELATAKLDIARLAGAPPPRRPAECARISAERPPGAACRLHHSLALLLAFLLQLTGAPCRLLP